jgi:gamma-butyrobetaine dioxygenase
MNFSEHRDTLRCAVERQDESLQLRWEDGTVDEFHCVWLRDNCGCTMCRHPVVGERLSDPASIPLDIVAVSAEISTAAKATLNIRWPDGHETSLTLDWLRSHSYGANRKPEVAVPLALWTAPQVRANVPEARYHEVMDSDEHLLAWLEKIRTFGFTIVRDVPTDDATVTKLADRIGKLRDSNFGLLWQVESRPTPDSLAYTSVKLSAHTDLVSREAQPGIQFLHCLVNESEGGESILVDGFAAAAELRRRSPQHFETLTRVPVTFRYQNDDTDVSATFPIIRLDHLDEFFEVRYSNALMAPLRCDPSDVMAFYAAYRAFSGILREPEFEFVFRLGAGDCEVFDNRRVMHGREAFSPQTGRRHLQGCYVDTDDFLSRLRVLNRKTDFRIR